MNDTKWHFIKDLAGFEHLVPITTPIDYFEQATKAYNARWHEVRKSGESAREQIRHREQWPKGGDYYGDRYLVEELGFRL